MIISSKTTKKLTEATYLSAENAWRYRVILRIAYDNYEKMKYFLYKEEIFDVIKDINGFENYNIDNLKQDLDSLEIWGNFITIQDTSKSRTLEEFKNRKFRYQISMTTVEIERTLVKLENMKEVSRGSLEISLIERFRETLEKIKNIDELSDKEIFSWWDLLNRDFKHLNENYQDYISKFYSPKTEEILKTTEFLIFKESFIRYLRDFIKGLQMNVPNIKYLLNHIENEEYNAKLLIKDIVQYEKKNISLDMEYDENRAYEIHYERYLNIKRWFLGDNDGYSMADNLLENTNEIIRKITRYALQIVELRTAGGSRKDEYKKLIDIFNNCKTIEDAHKTSSVTFGVMNSRHIVCNIDRKTESINSSIFEEDPTIVTVKPSNRYREKTASRVSVKDKSVMKKEKVEAILEKRRNEQKIIESKIIDNKLSFKNLQGISQNERLIFLKWLSKGLNKKDNSWVKNEYGKLYRVVNKNETEMTLIKCEDGDFYMPSYEIFFKDDVK